MVGLAPAPPLSPCRWAHGVVAVYALRLLYPGAIPLCCDVMCCAVLMPPPSGAAAAPALASHARPAPRTALRATRHAGTLCAWAAGRRWWWRCMRLCARGCMHAGRAAQPQVRESAPGKERRLAGRQPRARATRQPHNRGRTSGCQRRPRRAAGRGLHSRRGRPP